MSDEKPIPLTDEELARAKGPAPREPDDVWDWLDGLGPVLSRLLATIDALRAEVERLRGGYFQTDSQILTEGYFVSVVPPAEDRPGFLVPDGRPLSVKKYPKLFEVLGHTFGGDGDKFNLPDYRDHAGVADCVILAKKEELDA